MVKVHKEIKALETIETISGLLIPQVEIKTKIP
jgi:hypothetical protein